MTTPREERLSKAEDRLAALGVRSTRFDFLGKTYLRIDEKMKDLAFTDPVTVSLLMQLEGDR